jgi:hypothetical protein
LGIGAASLIVSIAQLAWSIFSDQRKHTAEPSADSIARQVRIALREQDTPVPTGTDRITDVVITEIIRLEGRTSAGSPRCPRGSIHGVFVFAEQDEAGFTRWATASQLPAAWPQSTRTGSAPVALRSSPLAPPAGAPSASPAAGGGR